LEEKKKRKASSVRSKRRETSLAVVLIGLGWIEDRRCKVGPPVDKALNAKKASNYKVDGGCLC